MARTPRPRPAYLGDRNELADTHDHPLSVAELNREVERLLFNTLGLVYVEGEVAGKRAYPSGHVYFTLKDAEATVSCVLFRTRRSRAADFTDGDLVRLRAKPSLYTARGQFQLVVESVEPAGAGALLAAFEALRQKLLKEGLFDADRKRSLPRFVHRLGVITSPQGDVRHDIARTLARRFPLLLPFKLYPCAVQGARAAPQIVATIEQANSDAFCDVLIIARGGGSLEDLWAFNEEIVVRAVANSAIPIVSGVGHETDTTLTDFAADLRAPTPTGAAEAVSPDQKELRARIQVLAQRARRQAERATQQLQERLGQIERRLDLQHPRRNVEYHAQRIDDLAMRIERLLRRRLAEQQVRLKQLADRHRRNHPLRQIQSMRENLARYARRLPKRAHEHIEQERSSLDQLTLRLRRIHRQIDMDLIAHDRGIKRLDRRLRTAGLNTRNDASNRLHALIRALAALSPLAVVDRGYAIVRNSEGRVISRTDQAPIGAALQITLSDGAIDVRVEDRR
ncbi:MAG: exodeoxyribonuclease VII large subunit [Thioalkalivibrionaceae bacterium]